MIKIVDNGEPLVKISDVCPGLIYKLDGNRIAYARKTVAEMLKKAKRYLPEGITFVVRDAWREKTRQEGVLKHFTKKFATENPDWDKKRIMEEVYKFAAPADGSEASGHLCGASLDLRLIRNGRRLPMKSGKLTYQENAKSHQPKLPKYIQKNRMMMYDALKKAGFANVDNEYWHWCYGDVEWATKTGSKIAIYGTADIR
jgi:D-alanyl-D-alanine dipeptidase